VHQPHSLTCACCHGSAYYGCRPIRTLTWRLTS
jgi:hypothetical protein